MGLILEIDRAADEIWFVEAYIEGVVTATAAILLKGKQRRRERECELNRGLIHELGKKYSPVQE